MAPEEKAKPGATKYGRMLADAGRFVDDLSGDYPIQVTWRRPAMEMYEKPDSFVVRAEFPGVEQDDVDISMSGDTLTIRGERRPPAKVKESQYHSSEIYYGNFTRSMIMPAEVDAKKVQARLESGMLVVVVPKAKGAKATKIKIQTS